MTLIWQHPRSTYFLGPIYGSADSSNGSSDRSTSTYIRGTRISLDYSNARTHVRTYEHNFICWPQTALPVGHAQLVYPSTEESLWNPLANLAHNNNLFLLLHLGLSGSSFHLLSVAVNSEMDTPCIPPMHYAYVHIVRTDCTTCFPSPTKWCHVLVLVVEIYSMSNASELPDNNRGTYVRTEWIIEIGNWKIAFPS